MSDVLLLRNIPALRAKVLAWRSAGESIALVPTMGALHAGHLGLMTLARQHVRRVLVSIFVNPAQFAPGEDLSTYPRPFADDIEKLRVQGVDGLFAPEAGAVYPPGFCSGIEVAGPAKAGLEDRFRPNHFGGVTTVVGKLLNMAQPDVAVFGEKDFQQLAVVKRMVADLDMAVKIIGAPTTREADGLALSSRNVFLSDAERARAPQLHGVLQECGRGIAAGEAVEDVLAAGLVRLAQAGFVTDYLELRQAHSLGPKLPGTEGALRLLVAARLGSTRLIDNIAVPGALPL